ncbi:uncharacterized protein CG3556 isoform X2 [Microplitis demolitor]|uniref:uncharacterized protein CG3556 isoform X2 n=1 Tax=Microplitis demolitor TaxID=69319 RepID=UPI00235B6F7B|nr:uncharacterized protein CG3556 isoform X2 [Microplitis demolitor]
MWGRASMAAVLIVWASVCARCQGTEIESRPTETEVESMVSRATTWLWYQRDQDAGWFNNTHWVLLALRLANLSRADNNPSSVSAELQLSNKQLELEIVVLLWRHREIGFSETNLARYTLALSALCKDPRQFHGHDLIGTLQHHEPPVDYDFALTTLAACSAQAHIRKRQIRRLLDITNAVQYHNIDTIAMVVLALRCIIQDHRHRNLGHFVHKPAMSLTKRQRVDGSFGDLRTTALAMQALKQVENEPLDNWNRSSALSWLINRQQPDGSFDQDVYLTAQIILGIIPKSLINIRSLNCRLSNNTLPGLTPNNNFNDNLISSSTTKNVETNTSAYESTASKLPTQTTSPHHQLVNVSYTLWVGTNETYHLTVTAPKNETFYGVMLLAAEKSPHFQFSASEWPNGHYVHTLAGYKEEPMSYHYWLLYRLTSPPDLSSPPGNQLVAPGGVDDLEISEGEYYLFWYKKL